MTRKTIECAKHGVGDLVFVCNHLILSLREQQPRGLYVWRDENGNLCGWCSECHERAEASGTGKDHVPLKFKVDTLCEKCFEPLRDLNGGGYKYE